MVRAGVLAWDQARFLADFSVRAAAVGKLPISRVEFHVFSSAYLLLPVVQLWH